MIMASLPFLKNDANQIGKCESFIFQFVHLLLNLLGVTHTTNSSSRFLRGLR